MSKELRTVTDMAGVPVLEIVREDDVVTIYEARDMDNQIRFATSDIAAILQQLGSLAPPVDR